MSSAHSHSPSSLREWKWSATEKAVAHQAFDKALKLELDEVVREAKERARRIDEPAELWELERWLGERRRLIDSTYDFRYSVLPLVFGSLLRNGRIGKNDLAGLAQDKLDHIFFAASL